MEKRKEGRGRKIHKRLGQIAQREPTIIVGVGVPGALSLDLRNVVSASVNQWLAYDLCGKVVS